MRLLFIKRSVPFPRASGQDVHSFQMMKALGELGHEVGLATVDEPSCAALDGLRLDHRISLARVANNKKGEEVRLTHFQERFRSYYGVERSWISSMRDAVACYRPDAVVGVGLDVLPYLGALKGTVRVWYAADEWVWHHLSQVRFCDRPSWKNLREAVVKGLYERAFAPAIDRAWVVSDVERRAIRWLAGVNAVDTLPNGVDASFFSPVDAKEINHSAVFWGRLDFGPNIQALQWFCRRVWPAVVHEVPHARFTIIGFNPSPAVRELARGGGITLRPNLSDLRAEVGSHAVVVLPFVSGGGIKNKLLEAASLAKPIICSRRGAVGVLANGSRPWIQADRPDQWSRAIVGLWNDRVERRRLGEEARRWVMENHTWTAAAHGAIEGLKDSLDMRMHI